MPIPERFKEALSTSPSYRSFRRDGFQGGKSVPADWLEDKIVEDLLAWEAELVLEGYIGHYCNACGHEWKASEDGTHDCAEILRLTAQRREEMTPTFQAPGFLTTRQLCPYGGLPYDLTFHASVIERLRVFPDGSASLNLKEVSTRIGVVQFHLAPGEGLRIQTLLTGTPDPFPPVEFPNEGFQDDT